VGAFGARPEFGAGLLTSPTGATAGLPRASETCGRTAWLLPPLFAAVPETGHNVAADSKFAEE
jgi:hypothetical protein